MEGTLSATATATATLPFFSKTLRRSTATAQICRSQLALFHSRRITTTAKAGAAASPVWCHLQCVSSSAASFASPSSSDVIVLDVRGMMCGGCASSVKRILENQLQVSSANVDHTTETAIVWPVSEAKATPDWQKVIGEELAKNLTNCGFDSNLRGEAAASEGEPS
ncbi:hypothetical protein L1987_19916 [Smallanthus sonchifolius]|uniref:Uncharacterized protein n=1 Tax=Smallanthus sonchifolius TaxID=185202 RepID=A0ACB9IQT6_9ASTR|nr:hypothetical protein L1987_19916 [Smallanthus sonchifolius]